MSTRRAASQPPRVNVPQTFWWRHGEPPTGYVAGARGACGAYIATPRVAKHRLFVWLRHAESVPTASQTIFARDDDTTFGILHSRFHEVWSLRLGTSLGKGTDPRYTPSTTFETFPFPDWPDAEHSSYRLRE